MDNSSVSENNVRCGKMNSSEGPMKMNSIVNQRELPILPLRNTVVFPFCFFPLTVGLPRSLKLIEEAFRGNQHVGLIASKVPEVEDPEPDQLYETGTMAKILRAFRCPGGSLLLIFHLSHEKILLTLKRKIQTEAQEKITRDQKNGLRVDEITFGKDSLLKIIQSYTRESGVRNLEREIGAVCRKTAMKITESALHGSNVRFSSVSVNYSRASKCGLK